MHYPEVRKNNNKHIYKFVLFSATVNNIYFHFQANEQHELHSRSTVGFAYEIAIFGCIQSFYGFSMVFVCIEEETGVEE